MNRNDVEVIVLLSAWSAGSSSVAGFLDKCGAHSCPPHVRTNDARTPNAYEPQILQKALKSCIDENTLRIKPEVKAFPAFLEPWLKLEKEQAASQGKRHIVLKHPLLAFFLPVIDKMANPIYVVIARPFAAIEKTRKRRNWAPVYGKKGANVIYSAIYSYMQNNSKEYLCVPYERFRDKKDIQQRLLDYTGMRPSPEQLAEANDWLIQSNVRDKK